MNKQIRFSLYIIAIAVCIVAVFVGVFALIIKQNKPQTKTVTDENGVLQQNVVVSPTVVTDNFKNLFNNSFNERYYNEQNVRKLKDGQPIVFEGLTYAQNVEGQYSLNLHVPIINIQGIIVDNLNSNTQNIFVNKANDIIASYTNTETENNTEQETNQAVVSNEITEIALNDVATSTQPAAEKGLTVYDIDYTGFINNDILSVVIMASLKEGSSPQRIMIQTYNYNLQTNSIVSIGDILANRGLNRDAVNNKIKNYVIKASEEAESVAQSGYAVYQRDLNSRIYDVANVKTFFQGRNGELYIVYAYGNTANTSEMDVIEI